MLARNHEHQLFFAIGPTLDVVHVVVRVGKPEVGQATAHGLQDFLAGALREVDRNFGIAAGKARQLGARNCSTAEALA